nr:integrase, catalytic region, zinc finger, CCHC-type, peptidase aspartic, catalytic [Tanacetum cinerariifolium]
MSQDRQTQNVRGNGGNQFGQYVGQVAQNQQGYNVWQNDGIQVAQNAIQNAGVQNGGNQNGLVVVPGIANQNGTGNVVAAMAEGTGNGNQARCYNCRGLGHIARNCTARPKRRDTAYLQTQLLIVKKEEAGIQLQAEEFDFMADADGLVEVKLNDNCYDNEIFNMLTQEEQYTDLLEPIPEPQLVPQNDNHLTFVAQIWCKVGEKYDKLEKCYQMSVYQEQCLTRKIIALHLSSSKQITTLNDEISNLNKQLLKEKSSISSLIEEKKKLKQDFKTQEDKFLDKKVDLEAKIKDLENILLKRDQTVQTMHMLNPKPNLFYHPDHKMALEEHDPPAVYDSEETLELAQVSREKIVIQDIMSIVQNGFVDVSSDLQTELDRTKVKLKLCIIKKEKEYTVLWNNWYTKCEECKYDNISYDKAYNDMQQKVERLQAQLRDLKGKSSDTPSASNTLDPLNRKLESKIIELEFQVVVQIYLWCVDSGCSKHMTRNIKLLINFVWKFLGIIRFGNDHIAAILGYEVTFRRNTCFIRDLDGVELLKGNRSTNLYTINLYDMASASPIWLVHTARTRRPRPKGNTRNVRVPSTSKSSEVKENVTVEDHRRTLLLSKS